MKSTSFLSKFTRGNIILDSLGVVYHSNEPSQLSDILLFGGVILAIASIFTGSADRPPDETHETDFIQLGFKFALV